MRKRFTRGGGAPLTLTVIALLISLAASFEEYLARFIYNLAFTDNKADKVFVSELIGYFTMERNSVSVIRMYTEKAFIMALISFAAFIVLAASARKKKIVSGEAWLMILSAAGCAIEPVIYMIYFFSNGLHKNFSDSSDGVRFRSFYGFLIYALPLIAAFLLILAGFILLVRLAREKSVDISGEPIELEGVYDTAVDAPNAVTVMEEAAVPAGMYAAPLAEEAAMAEEPIADAVRSVTETAAPVDIAEEPQGPEPLIQPENEPQLVFCPSCGNKLAPTAKFCNNCGTKMQ